MAAPSVAESALRDGQCQSCGHQAEVPVWAFEDDHTGFCTGCESMVQWEAVDDDG